MAKILIFVAIIVAVYVLFFRKKSVRNDLPKNDEVSFEMVECATCGTYSAKDEAIKKGDKYFCSTKCLEA